METVDVLLEKSTNEEKIITLVLSDTTNIEFESTFNDIPTNFEADFNTVQAIESNDYLKLMNKPKINGEVVEGDKTLEQYHLESLSTEEIIHMWNQKY